MPTISLLRSVELGTLKIRLPQGALQEAVLRAGLEAINKRCIFLSRVLYYMCTEI